MRTGCKRKNPPALISVDGMHTPKAQRTQSKPEKHLGVSLLFVHRKNGILEGVSQSYALQVDEPREVIQKVQLLGTQQNRYDPQQGEYIFEYFGLKDIFEVKGPLEEGALLGRTNIWNQTLEEAQSLLLPHEEFTFYKQLGRFDGKYYLSSPVYYVDDTDPEDTRSISCYCLIESSKPSEVLQKALSIAKSRHFQEKIIGCDFEELRVEDLHFIGFEDIVVIYDNIQQEGAFLKLCKEINSLEELSSLLIEEEEEEEEEEGFFENLESRKNKSIE